HAAELRLRFTKVTQQLRRNVIRLTVERRVGSPAVQIATIEASGFVLDPVGHVVTFGSALDQADRIAVRFVNLPGVPPRRAFIVGTDPGTAVGVLDVGPIELPPMPLGAPDGAPAPRGGVEVEKRIVVSMSGMRGGEGAIALGVLDGGGAPPAGGRMYQISV